MNTIHLYGSKGGVQTSTIAALTALSHDGQRLLIDTTGDQHCILGLTSLDVRECHTSLSKAQWPAPALALTRTTESFVGTMMCEASVEGFDLVVVDHGVANWEGARPLGGTHVIVVQPCYLSVRRAILADQMDAWIMTGTATPRALTERDVTHAMGSEPLITLPYDPAIARSMDAGLFIDRIRPRTFDAKIRTLIDRTEHAHG